MYVYGKDLIYLIFKVLEKINKYENEYTELEDKIEILIREIKDLTCTKEDTFKNLCKEKLDNIELVENKKDLIEKNLKIYEKFMNNIIYSLDGGMDIDLKNNLDFYVNKFSYGNIKII